MLPLKLLFILGAVHYSIAQSSQDPSNDDYTCSATKPCKLGCCGKTGVCGLGPQFCSSENCMSSCDQKSECDPGWGSQWSTAENCPLNVCCSKYGFCGTTSDFCGNKSVIEPSCGGQSTAKRTIGYYEGWSQSRACDGMAPEAIPAGAYTHLNYAFAFIDPQSFAVAPMSESDLGLYSRFTSLKEANPGLQTWISIGGWSMNDPNQPTAATFSTLAGSQSAQQAFFKSLISFMQTYGFDGVDIDWEYPVAPERSGSSADFANYPSFLRNLKSALGSNGHTYGLSITLPSSYWYMRHFDIVSIEPIVDWFNVMTYDLHGTWDSTDKFIGPVVNAHTNLTEIKLSMDLLWRNNIDPSKVVMGLGFYGRSFTLENPACSSPGCAFSSGGNPGPCSATSGILLDSEIQSIIASGVSPTLDSDAAVKQLVWDTNQWVSYDDQQTFQMKIDWANNRCIGGTMVWAVSGDDSNATSSQSLGTINGYLSQKSLWGGSTPQTQSISQCVWGDCAPPGKATCPSNLSPAKRGQGKSASNSAIYSGCPSGQSRNYCCPADDVPICNWVGTAPFCAHNSCPSGQVAVATDSSGTGAYCAFNHKTLCCTATGSTAAVGQCKWSGSGPFCAGIGQNAACADGFPDYLTDSVDGAGGESACFVGEKSLCCTDPIPYQNCEWTQQPHAFFFPNTCNKGCPAGKQIVAESFIDHQNNGVCLHNTGSYFCCDEFIKDPPTSDPPNYCSLADNAYVESGELDSDGNPADFIELYWYEDECYPVPNTGDPDAMKRSIMDFSIADESVMSRAEPAYGRNQGHIKFCDEFGDCYNILNPEAVPNFDHYLASALNASHLDLLPRGSRQPSICKNRKQIAKFKAKSYPAVTSLSSLGRHFFYSAVNNVQQGVCVALPLLSGVRQLGVNFVTEHVMELQTPAQFATSMLNGILPSGDAAPGGKFDWTKVFGQTGYMFQTWAQLGIAKPPGLNGDTPAEAIYYALGNSQDIGNLQILDAATNSVKAGAWQLFENIISDKRFNKAGTNGQIEMINRLYQTLLEYLNNGDVQSSLGHSYTAIKSVMGALDTAASTSTSVTGPSGTTFAQCWVTYFDDFVYQFEGNLQDNLDRLINTVLPVWKKASGSKKPGANAIYQELLNKAKNLKTDIVFKTGFIS